MRVHWVAVPKAMRARRLNNHTSRPRPTDTTHRLGREETHVLSFACSLLGLQVCRVVVRRGGVALGWIEWHGDRMTIDSVGVGGARQLTSIHPALN
jgi:hypothetical protein